MPRVIRLSHAALPYVESFLAGFGTGVLVSGLTLASPGPVYGGAHSAVVAQAGVVYARWEI